jgi:hypothetical protein
VQELSSLPQNRGGTAVVIFFVFRFFVFRPAIRCGESESILGLKGWSVKLIVIITLIEKCYQMG